MIVEATAGNTGIGLALIGINRGYRVRLFLPEGFSEEKAMIMRALGAEVIRTPEAEGMQGAIDPAPVNLPHGTPTFFLPRNSIIPPTLTTTTKPPRPKFFSRWRAVSMPSSSAPVLPEPLPAWRAM